MANPGRSGAFISQLFLQPDGLSSTVFGRRIEPETMRRRSSPCKLFAIRPDAFRPIDESYSTYPHKLIIWFRLLTVRQRRVLSVANASPRQPPYVGFASPSGTWFLAIRRQDSIKCWSRTVSAAFLPGRRHPPTPPPRQHARFAFRKRILNLRVNNWSVFQATPGCTDWPGTRDVG
jgi:hypothetical protein